MTKNSANSKGRSTASHGKKKVVVSEMELRGDGTEDRRVRRTRNALGDALIALMLEKPFNSITVQQVLDRARVGRATFYSHFRDKDDLFLSDVEDFFNHMAQVPARDRNSRRVAPVAELFTHVADVPDFFAALVASGQLEAVMEIGQECFARGIEGRLATLAPEIPAARRRAMSQGFSGAMLALMRWWLAKPHRESAVAMDELFHALVWAGVAGRANNIVANDFPCRPSKPPE